MNTTEFYQWAQRHPAAAADFLQMVNTPADTRLAPPASEARAQQEARMEAGRRGMVLWRNNVGATKAKEPCVCPACHFKFNLERPPIRYGLANDSEKMNKRVKSSDLIGIKPVLITQAHVGHTIGQFVAVEVKAPGVPINLKDEQQAGQAAFGGLVTQFGGLFEFSYGGLTLS
ncbi:hypothetical protein NVP1009O_46 [Vibrio phage 1.009.O._10N.261.51.C9]|nr:hypothetical protein NVP1009O_46 [Vibrio phage 1.009.O._10N.261.51.C9]